MKIMRINLCVFFTQFLSLRMADAGRNMQQNKHWNLVVLYHLQHLCVSLSFSWASFVGNIV